MKTWQTSFLTFSFSSELWNQDSFATLNFSHATVKEKLQNDGPITVLFNISLLILHGQKCKFVDFLYTASTPICKIPMDTQPAIDLTLSSDNLSRNSCIRINHKETRMVKDEED